MIRNTDTHGNRTGMGVAPHHGREMLEADADVGDELRYDEDDEYEDERAAGGDDDDVSHEIRRKGQDGLSEVRMSYAREGFTVGSMPPVSTLKMAGKTLVKSRRGSLDIFVDKLGERLGFERMGVRLYEALISKLLVHGSWQGGPTEMDLARIRGEELAHFLMLREQIERIGGDPTAVTPSANVHAMASTGIGMVLADPRTDLEDCLEAILVAELEDNDGWQTLSTLASNFDEGELAQGIKRAVDDEARHLSLVRGWLRAALAGTPAQPGQEASSSQSMSEHAGRGGNGNGNDNDNDKDGGGGGGGARRRR